MKKGPRLSPAKLVALTLVWLAAMAPAFVWACVPQPVVTLLPKSSGPPGTDIEITGFNFDPGKVEVRWNTLDGPILLSGDGPSFSSKFKVPTAKTGLYVLLVSSREQGGGLGLTARIPFEVIGTRTPREPAGGAAKAAESRQSAAMGTPSTLILIVFGWVLAAIGFGLGAVTFLRRSRSRL